MSKKLLIKGTQLLVFGSRLLNSFNCFLACLVLVILTSLPKKNGLHTSRNLRASSVPAVLWPAVFLAWPGLNRPSLGVSVTKRHRLFLNFPKLAGPELAPVSFWPALAPPPCCSLLPLTVLCEPAHCVEVHVTGSCLKVSRSSCKFVRPLAACVLTQQTVFTLFFHLFIFYHLHQLLSVKTRVSNL